MAWPAPIFATIEEYIAYAALMDHIYDPGDHTMITRSGIAFSLCPDTLVRVFPDYWVDESRRRARAVFNGKLGPKAHPDYNPER